ncbi:MAG: amidohydrolase family protein [Acidimicrobiales bacterium]
MSAVEHVAPGRTNRIVDADGHLVEMPDLFRDHTDARHHDLALGFATDELGYDCVTFGGRPIMECTLTVPGDRRTQGAFMEDRRAGRRATFSAFETMPEQYWNPSVRRDYLQQWGIDATVLFPNWALTWEQLLQHDHDALRINMAAWNRWAVTVQAEGRGHLYPVGHIMLDDPDWAIGQVRELASGGVKLVKIPHGLAGGKRLSHPDLGRFWSTMEELDLAAVFHIGATYNRQMDAAWTENDPTPAAPLLSFPTMAHDLQLVLADLILNGVLASHPGLRLGVMELMVDWIPLFLRRIDGAPRAHESFGGRKIFELADKPSDYFRRQVRVGTFAGEDPGGHLAQVGPLLMFGGDYPHSEGEPSLDAYRAKAGPIDPAMADAFYGGNMEFLLGRG